ncbi:hypothetical protein D3C73_1556040 [compost metagenome]
MERGSALPKPAANGVESAQPVAESFLAPSEGVPVIPVANEKEKEKDEEKMLVMV